jgi:hypothetical protein
MPARCDFPFVRVFSAITLVVGVAVAHAEIGTDVGLAYSDNLNRVEDAAGEQADRMLVARVGGQSQYLGPALEGDVQWELGGIKYLENTYDDEPMVSLDGSADFDLVERRVSWILRDRMGRQSFDPFSPTTPDSREYVNVFVTGPEFLFPISTNTAAEMAFDYTDVWYEERTLDNSGTGGRLGLRVGLGPRQSLAFVGAVQKVKFDDALLYDAYDRHQAFIEYESDRRRGDIRIALGRTEIRGLDDRQDSPMIEASWIRSISASSNFSLQVQRGLSNATDLFQLGQGGTPDAGTIENVVGVSDPFELTFASAELSISKPRVSFTVAYTWQNQEFNSLTGLDRDVATWNARLRRDLSPQFSLDLATYVSDQDFATLDRRDSERSSSIGLAWQLGRRTAVEFQLARFGRSSTVAANSYDENRVFLTFRYGVPLSRIQATL